MDKNNNISTAYLFNAYHLTNGHLIYILPASVIKAIPKLEILVPNSDVEEKAEIISKWVGSKYLGAMSWDKGMLQARKLGMRLPTYNEFREAFGLGIIADWNEIDGDGFYWTSEVNSVDFFETLVTLFDVDGGGVAYNYKDFHSHVRCIR